MVFACIRQFDRKSMGGSPLLKRGGVVGTLTLQVSVSKVAIVQVCVTIVDGHQVVFSTDQVLQGRLHFCRQRHGSCHFT